MILLSDEAAEADRGKVGLSSYASNSQEGKISVTSRFWDDIVIGGIVIVLALFLTMATPLFRRGVAGILLSVALTFLLVMAIPLFGRAVAGMRLLLVRAKQTGDPTYSEFIFGRSKRMAFLRGGTVVILSFIGLAVLVLALSLQLFHSVPGNPPAVLVATAVKSSPQPQTPEELYLDLLKKTLTRAQVADRYERYTLRPNAINRLALRLLEPVLHDGGFDLVGLRASNAEAYMKAGGSNSVRLDDGETMIGLRQLDNMQFCVEDVLRRKVPGDLIEAGAWRGGVTIFMRGILKAYSDTDRKVWVADSFEGLPAPDRAIDAYHYREGQMAVSVDEVKENFARYGLLDDRVRFLKGFFNKTLPGAPIDKLAVLRADADLYESTMDALNNLYPKLSVGGYAIFDDYVQEPAVKRAIDEYRASHGITEPILQIDGQAIYWQRAK